MTRSHPPIEMEDQERDPRIAGQENDPIIEDKLDRSTSSNDTRLSDDLAIKVKSRRTIVVEPVWLLYTLASTGASPVLTQYLYARFEHGYPILVNQSHSGDNMTKNDTSALCADTNKSDPSFIAIQSAQAESAQWNMYLQLCSSIIAIFTTVIYGSLSDARGRKIVLIGPCLARLLKYIIDSVVIYYNLPLYLLLIGCTLDGLSGGFTTVLMGVFSYIADTTSKKQRSFRIAVLEGCMCISMALAELGMGYFIKATGYLYPYMTCTGIMGLTVVYVVFFVPETIVPDKAKTVSIKRSFRNIYHVYTFTENKRHIKLFLLCLMIFAFLFSFGGKSMQTLFVMNAPLCWGPVLIGIYSATSGMVLQIPGLIGLKLLKCLKVREIWIAAAGVVSATGGLVLNAFATTDLMMYMVCAINFLSILPIPMFRSLISCQVNPDEQGRAFAGVACVEEICMLGISFVFSLVYQKTLYFMPGFIFLVAAGFGVITLFLIVIYRTVEKRSAVYVLDEVLPPEEAAVN
ncbi:lysosomal proton-coupled steroid conjugate and bile acid symporter SLC46A3-like [Lineus longissimus]|uniref:lysosomal proton-coupled steroid conjugate and bile acid symporter SLC46A3-like n=1 Tax=Lineus longissimus TaxID=88925 RepID=UPI002B4DEBA7